MRQTFSVKTCQRSSLVRPSCQTALALDQDDGRRDDDRRQQRHTLQRAGRAAEEGNVVARR